MTSRILAAASVAAAALLLLPAAARAQSLSDRVAARDGDVRLTYAARAGACGDGRDVVGMGHALYVHNSIESWGRWSGVSCAPGPVRVTLSVRNRAVERARVRVGGKTPSADSGVRDAGTVSGPEAAAYFLALAGRAESSVAKEAVLAAALADGADVVPGLLRIARDTSRPSAARRRAVQWSGELGGPGIVRELEAIADRSGDDAKVREAALASLAQVGSDDAVAALVRHARGETDGDERMERSAVFWLGQTDSPLARRTLRAIVDSAAAPERVRAAAVFAIGHGDATTDDDIKFLESRYARFESKKMRDQVLMAVANQPGGGAWLLERARDAREPVASRKQAIFWAGQGDQGASVKELTALYAALDERELKEHVIFVLSQRDESAATDQLIMVARNDPDPALRKRALFWLGQKNDPRAAELIRDLVSH